MLFLVHFCQICVVWLYHFPCSVVLWWAPVLAKIHVVASHCAVTIITRSVGGAPCGNAHCQAYHSVFSTLLTTSLPHFLPTQTPLIAVFPVWFTLGECFCSSAELWSKESSSSSLVSHKPVEYLILVGKLLRPHFGKSVKYFIEIYIYGMQWFLKQC